MTKQVALYARVSTDGQTVENQLKELRAVAKRHKWKIVETFTDDGISGAKGRDQRPGFDALCNGIARRDFDMVAVWALDRLGRSLSHLVTFLDELHAKGLDLYIEQQAIDTSTPMGAIIFQICGAFAQFERAMISERVKAGMARTNKRIGRPRIHEEKEREILAERVRGKGIKRIAREVGVGVKTVQRVVRESEKPAPKPRKRAARSAA